MINFKKYSRALVIGAGSGRDMASSVLITEKLRERGIKVDLAGFLTPWALHSFNGKLERPINELRLQTHKFLADKKKTSLDGRYFEPQLLRLNKEINLGINRFYLFSLQYGTHELKQALEKLIFCNSYDLIVAVDVGGDILARKKDLGSVFTPIVDLSCLEILNCLAVKIDKLLIVISPGIDGELTKSQLEGIFTEFRKKKLILESYFLNNGENYDKFKIVNEKLNQRTDSYSHTESMIRRIVEKEFPSKTIYTKVLKMFDKEWKVSFEVNLSKNLSRRIFYFDLDKIKAQRRDISIDYKNILEAFAQLKERGVGGTEIDLTYVPQYIKDGKAFNSIFVLSTFNKVSEEQRKEILDYGLQRIKHILCFQSTHKK